MAKLGFFKKREKKSGNISVDKIRLLSSKGLSETEIVEALKKEGHSKQNIDKILRETVKGAVLSPKTTESLRPPTQSEIKAKATGSETFEIQAPKLPHDSLELREFPMGSVPKPKTGSHIFDEEIDENMQILPPPRPPGHKESIGREEVEEIVEAVLEDKWKDFEDIIRKIEQKVNELETKVAEMESIVNELKSIKKDDIAEIKTNVSSYKDLITELTSRMESTETIIKNSLTPMMETLRSLSEAVKAIKKSKK